MYLGGRGSDRLPPAVKHCSVYTVCSTKSANGHFPSLAPTYRTAALQPVSLRHRHRHSLCCDSIWRLFFVDHAQIYSFDFVHWIVPSDVAL